MLVKSKSVWRISLMLLLTNNICLPFVNPERDWFWSSSPCLIILARYELDVPVTSAPTNTSSTSTVSTQTTQKQKESHFFLLMQFQDNKKFEVKQTKPQNQISSLTDLLFPDKSSEKIFIFDSRNLNDYVEVINTLPNDNNLIKWWLSTQSWYTTAKKWGREISSDDEVKNKLIQSLNLFNTKVKSLTEMPLLTDPKQPLIAVARMIPNERNEEKIEAKKKAIESFFKKDIFKNISQQEPNGLKGTLSEKETSELKALMERITTAHIAYVADLSSNRLIDALPRAIYREVETLCKTLRVSAPGFKPFLLDTQFWKRSAINSAKLASMAGLGVLFGSLATKYSWGTK